MTQTALFKAPDQDAFAPSPFIQEDHDALMTIVSIVRGIDVGAMATTEGQVAAARVNAILDKAAAEIRDAAVMLVQTAPKEEEQSDDIPF
jgi:phosphoribosylcarboxyaminoimidazole (NCAIR) mutase